MKGLLRSLLILSLAGATLPAFGFRCQVCGRDGYNYTGVHIFTDHVTGEKEYVCVECMTLPRCYVCGLPVKENGVALGDGRVLCARDARTAVTDSVKATEICERVKDDLDRMFSRFTEFPTNIDISMMDSVDVGSVFSTVASPFESPNVQGLHHPAFINGKSIQAISLLTGLPETRLKEVCAHELAHAWVDENVPPARHASISRDTQEGFCELIGYLLMDQQHEEAEKKAVLENTYTRGQVKLFIEAEQQYGFEQVLEWMQYGETARLEAGQLAEIRNVNIPADHPAKTVTTAFPAATVMPPPPRVFTNLVLQGIIPGNRPAAIINGRSVFVDDEVKLPVGGTKRTVHCLAIGTDSVRIRDKDSGQEQRLSLVNP